ncbi:MAG: hypothetical protein JXA23_05075 [Bacteroidales bacterium]|nr:hypothetical protein [Bacteroidales bacterium]
MEALTPMMILRKKIRKQIRRKRKENEALLNLIKALESGRDAGMDRVPVSETDVDHTQKSNTTSI